MTRESKFRSAVVIAACALFALSVVPGVFDSDDLIAESAIVASELPATVAYAKDPPSGTLMVAATLALDAMLRWPMAAGELVSGDDEANIAYVTDLATSDQL